MFQILLETNKSRKTNEMKRNNKTIKTKAKIK